MQEIIHNIYIIFTEIVYNMSTFCGICDIINWDEVINHISSKTGWIVDYEQLHEFDNYAPYPIPKNIAPEIVNTTISPIRSMYEMANIRTPENGGTAKWELFIVNFHFDQILADKFAEFCKVDNFTSAFISKVMPGNFVPWHWDARDGENEKIHQVNKPKYQCHMSEPNFGHAFITETEVFYNQQQGAVYKFNNRKDWHAGVNCGFVPKYLFSLW